jgi:Rrf2 family protein
MAEHQKDTVTTALLEKELGIPRPFLRKIFLILKDGGLVTSAKGNMGGFKLVRQAKEISIADIVRVFQPDETMTNCYLEGRICKNNATCLLRHEVKKIEEYAHKRFKKITIQYIINNTKNRRMK